MGDLADELEAIEHELLPPLPPRRRPWRALGLVLAGLLAVLAALVWSQREEIADDLISDRLERMDLPATYEVEAIGASEEVLKNVVIGDPARPDLTVERVIVGIRPRLGAPEIGRITLVKPRLYGSYRNGKPSFGALDKVLFTGSKEPFRLPDLDVRIEDGRALIDSDHGRFGVKLAGEGELRGGFAGRLAAIATEAHVAGCRIERPTLYGTISVTDEKPRFAGPLRVPRLACADGTALAGASADLDAGFDRRLDGADVKATVQTGAIAAAGNRLAALNGTVRGVWRGGALTVHHKLAGKNLRTAQAAMATVGLDGTVRADQRLTHVDAEGDLAGTGVSVGTGPDAALERAGRAAAATFAAPLLAEARAALRREAPGSRLGARYMLRRTGALTTLTVPQASLRGGSGDTLLALSRFQLVAGRGGGPVMSGNFTTGGAGLPRIAGRIAQQSARTLTTRLTMAEYRAGGSSLAVPTLAMVQNPDGSLGFAGQARISGALPGGAARNLVLPLAGDWSPRGGLAMWRGCVPVAFDQLALANLTLARQRLTLCPPRGQAIVRSDRAGTRIAAGAPALALSGRLGQTPVRIVSGPVGFAIPGVLAARSLDITLGPPASASRFRIANLTARIGGDIAGSFAGSDVHLAAVPLDLRQTSGRWRYARGVLTIADAAFRLEDRQMDDRFRPLVAQGGTLTLADNRIAASAMLREPGSGREVVRADIRHNLADGRGWADLTVPGLVFDQAMQPDTLTRLALGVIANAQGKVTGTGRIDWTPSAVTSTGRFRSDGLDFAAEFGPVRGAAGEIVFTDLLGMVTAPGQRLRVAAINPGIEVNDGTLDFALRPGNVLAIDSASWPFLDGKLTLRPVKMTLGANEVRRYELVIEGLNAARFIQRMELSNISATGTFDGVLPLVFDENGGRIEGGHLVARAPGGNVSYVGALTYKDLSPMANFAFDALKSLNYREMTIAMDGAIAGELVTRVQLKGVSQGEGARRNFLTRRVARLPIQFNINLRAPFMQLVSSFRSFYDPAYLRDPMSLGLLGPDGKPLPRSSDSDIQPPASETRP